MVLLKLLLATVSATTNQQQPTNPNGFPPGMLSRMIVPLLGERAKYDDFPSAAQEQPPMPPPSLDEIDVIRHREITSKAVSAIILLTLKWFKVSRRFSDLGRSTRSECRPRCYEVSSSRAASLRYKLFVTHPQDVWPAGGLCFSSFES